MSNGELVFALWEMFGWGCLTGAGALGLVLALISIVKRQKALIRELNGKDAK